MRVIPIYSEDENPKAAKMPLWDLLNIWGSDLIVREVFLDKIYRIDLKAFSV